MCSMNYCVQNQNHSAELPLFQHGLIIDGTLVMSSKIVLAGVAYNYITINFIMIIFVVSITAATTTTIIIAK